ncbi:MAG: PSD1 and planctomycete cytochrome C domain-containing protein [Verrucomicrobiia bacterium]
MMKCNRSRIFPEFLVWCSAALLCSSFAVSGAADGAKGDDVRFFEGKIQPLLEARCFKCHSHQGGKMKGGLTLDSRNGWATGGGRGPAVVPCKPDESLLLRALSHADPDLQMPPKAKLPKEEIALLEEWIRRGAPDPRKAKTGPADAMDWWSLRPLRRPEIPAEVDRAGGKLHPIDAFVRARLKAEGVKPAPRADRRTLIRRLYFNLHGLPPTPEQVAAFVSHKEPLAYERLIESLLTSPRYGERWSRRWLDTIHFADSHGCEHDVLRPNAWRFRDYVIESFNRDTPWARFIREQLAADVFFAEDPKLTVALGFIAAGPFEYSRFQTAPITFAYLDRDDMVTQTMSSFASVTANCARCHDHKFDPISQEDYYGLQAVFAGVGKGDVEYDEDLGMHRSRKRWKALAKAADQNVRAVLLAAENEEIVKEWESARAAEPVVWKPLKPEVFLSTEGIVSLTRLPDNSILSGDVVPPTTTYTVIAPTTATNITAIRLDVLTDDGLPMKGPGRQDNGNFHLSEFQIRLFKEGEPKSSRLSMSRATSDFDQQGWTIAHAIDNKTNTAWGIHPRVGEAHYAVFELSTPIKLTAPAKLSFTLKQLHGRKHLIGRFRLSMTDAVVWRARALPRVAEDGLKVPLDKRTPDQRAAIAKRAIWIRSHKELEAFPPAVRVYAAAPNFIVQNKEHEMSAPKVVHVLKRGDIEKPGKVAELGAIAVIKALPGRFKLDAAKGESARRAALADWLASPENPLTWRSVVNRVWQDHFGRGLCDTPNDFGRMGGKPSHPELLDWLAVWFRDDAKGSLKALHRLILTSETYRQSSVSAGGGKDAGNRLLSRMNRQRLDAESFRDGTLQICGRLDTRMGGPGVQQFTTSKGIQLTPKLHYDAFDWNAQEAARRSIYRVVWRGMADPFMEALDFPDLGLLAPKRSFSVSSLQALTLFNNDFVLHHSERLAERLEREAPTNEARVKLAIQLVYQREPQKDEVSAFVGYAAKHGWPAICRVLLNSNEFLFVD